MNSKTRVHFAGSCSHTNCIFAPLEEAPTGDSRDEAQGPQHPEGSQRLHVKPAALLHWHTRYLIDGIQGKGEEAEEKY